MKNSLNSDYIYVLATVIFTVASQLLIKWRISTVYIDFPEHLSDKLYFFLKVLIDPFIILALVFVLLSGFNWILAMTRFELSSVYPMVVVGLMLITTVSSIILFSEEVNIYKVSGIIISLFGVFILYIGNK
ncbi:hypothetical protein A1QI_06985 [Vibrio genomosp. F10 str. 9ZB36]|nr:hypothetical protein A1QI_06985 [Vibrio genomosp. F10 str. 9ZB36]